MAFLFIGLAVLGTISTLFLYCCFVMAGNIDNNSEVMINENNKSNNTIIRRKY